MRSAIRTSLGDELLRDLEAGEGLPRAAGHDQLAAVSGFQPLPYALQSLSLVVAQLLLLGENSLPLRGEDVPVNRAVAQVGEGDPDDRDALPRDHRLRVVAPGLLRRVDDHAPLEGRLSRRRDEAVDIDFCVR